MSAAAVRFESVRPRDVDLLVLEELSITSAFRSWLLETSGLASDSESTPLLAARDSLATSEAADSDTAFRRAGVELGLEIDGERLLLCLATASGLERSSRSLDSDIERANAPSGSDGFDDRIRTRRGRALESEEWDDCRAVLLAPATSIDRMTTDGATPFDATVPLESIRDRFATRETDRGTYRAAMVTAAIERGRHATNAPSDGGDGDGDERVPEFVHRYRSIAADRDPALEVEIEFAPALAGTSDESTATTGPALSIDAPSLASDHELVHALEPGTVELRIPGAADHVQPFAARYASVIPTTTSLLTDGDALVLRQSVPSIDTAAGDTTADADATSGTDDALEAALDAVADLLDVSDRVRDRTS